MTVTELFSDIDFLCDSTSATYPTATKLRNINIEYQRVATVIWESAGNWQYDDSNATDFGIATTNIVANQQDYELPSTCQRLQRVEVNGELIPQRDIHDMTLATAEEQGVCYDVVGRSVFLYPTPGTAATAGLKVFFDRDVTNLTTGSDVPGFATGYHRILSLKTAMDFSRNDDDLRKWVAERAVLEKGLTRFYGKRNVEGKTRMNPAGKKRWRAYL